MNRFFENYLNGIYKTGELYFIPSVCQTEWGVEFRLIEEEVRSDSEKCMVIRWSDPMNDSDWEIGSFSDLENAIIASVEDYNDYMEMS